eukprot:8833587-Alexandrium_andersonii.AAC.1
MPVCWATKSRTCAASRSRGPVRVVGGPPAELAAAPAAAGGGGAGGASGRRSGPGSAAPAS